MLYNYSPSIRIKISQEIVNKNCDQLTIDFEDVLRENINNYNGRDYLNIAPKEQPPRKLSGKRTVKKIFWKETSSHRRSNSLRYQYRWGKVGAI